MYKKRQRAQQRGNQEPQHGEVRAVRRSWVAGGQGGRGGRRPHWTGKWPTFSRPHPVPISLAIWSTYPSSFQTLRYRAEVYHASFIAVCCPKVTDCQGNLGQVSLSPGKWRRERSRARAQPSSAAGTRFLLFNYFTPQTNEVKTIPGCATLAVHSIFSPRPGRVYIKKTESEWTL